MNLGTFLCLARLGCELLYGLRQAAAMECIDRVDRTAIAECTAKLSQLWDVASYSFAEYINCHSFISSIGPFSRLIWLFLVIRYDGAPCELKNTLAQF